MRPDLPLGLGPSGGGSTRRGVAPTKPGAGAAVGIYQTLVADGDVRRPGFPGGLNRVETRADGGPLRDLRSHPTPGEITALPRHPCELEAPPLPGAPC